MSLNFVQRLLILLPMILQSTFVDASMIQSSLNMTTLVPVPLSFLRAGTEVYTQNNSTDAKYSVNTYIGFILATGVFWYIVVAAVFFFMPLRVLTRLAIRIFGFETSSALFYSKSNRTTVMPLEIIRAQQTKQKETNESVDSLHTHLLSAPERVQMYDEPQSDRFASHAPRNEAELLHVSLHTRPHSLFLMNRLVDFDETELLVEEQKAAEASCSVWCPWYACVSCYTAQCFSRGCLNKRPTHPVYRIRLLLRQLLVWAIFTSFCLLLSLTFLLSVYTPIGENQQYCPADILSSGAGDEWECYAFPLSNSYFFINGATYVNCNFQIPPQLAGLAMTCFKFMSPTAEHVLSSVSTVAALLTLVIGGVGTVFAWFLASIKTRQRVNTVYILPIALLFLLFVLLYVFKVLHGVVAVNTLWICVVLSSIMIQLRKAVGFEAERQDGTAIPTSKLDTGNLELENNESNITTDTKLEVAATRDAEESELAAAANLGTSLLVSSPRSSIQVDPEESVV